MSKKTLRKSVNMVGSQEDEPDDASDVEEEGMEEAVRDFADGERYIKLYRHPSELTGGRPRLLGPLSREDFNDVTIQERFGGGHYFGRWRRKNGQYTRFNFDIDGDPKVMTRAQEADAARKDGEEETPYGFLTKPKEPQEESEPDRGIGTADILRIMAETRRESREEMRMLLELMRPVNQPPDATEKVFSLVEKIVPLISQGGGDGSGSNPWLFALSQLKEPLMKMVDTIHTAVTRPPAQAGGSPAPPVPTDKRIPSPVPPTPQPEPTPTESAPKSEDVMLAESFKPYLAMLAKAAEHGKDPGLYCDLILDQIPVFAYDRLRVWLSKPGCLDLLEAQGSRAFTLDERAWFDTLRGLLLDALKEEGDDAPRSIQPVVDRHTPAVGPTDSD